MTFLKLIHYQKLQLVQPLSRVLDYVQLLFSGSPNNLEQLKIYAGTSLTTRKEWYSENGLKMNANKTQAFFFATPNFNKHTETFQMAYGR